MQKISNLTKQQKIAFGIGIPIGLLMLCCCGGVIFAFTPPGQAMIASENATSTAQSISSAHVTATVAQYARLHPQATATLRPTATPIPIFTSTVTNSPLPTPSDYESALHDFTYAANNGLEAWGDNRNTIGPQSRHIPRLASIEISGSEKSGWSIAINWSIDYRISNSDIYEGAQKDVYGIAETLYSLAQVSLGRDINSLHLNGTYLMEDALGNISETRVLSVNIPPTMGNQVNWDNETYQMFWNALKSNIASGSIQIAPSFHP